MGDTGDKITKLLNSGKSLSGIGISKCIAKHSWHLTKFVSIRLGIYLFVNKARGVGSPQN
jgi:hypothetical protein